MHVRGAGGVERERRREGEKDSAYYMMHLHRQVPFWIMVCGHVGSINEGEENAYLPAAA